MIVSIIAGVSFGVALVTYAMVLWLQRRVMALEFQLGMRK